MPRRSGYTCSGRGFFASRGNRVGFVELGQGEGVDSLVGGFHWLGRVEAMDASFIQFRMSAGHGTVREFLLVVRAGVVLGRGRFAVGARDSSAAVSVAFSPARSPISALVLALASSRAPHACSGAGTWLAISSRAPLAPSRSGRVVL